MVVILYLVTRGVELIVLEETIPRLGLEDCCGRLVLPTFFVLNVADVLRLFLLRLPVTNFREFKLVIVSSIVMVSVLVCM